MAHTPSVTLGNPDNKLSKDDLALALFCSMAVYKNNAEAENLLHKAQTAYPSIAPVKYVHISLNLPKGQKFLVAYTEDCAFIAFRGTESLNDMACDIRIDRHVKFGGWFHRGFFDRAGTFMGPNHNPLPDLLQNKMRIIFCGHSLGGAVAHMVLFRFLLESEEQISNETVYPSDSLISIAFGAPHICDEMAARKINRNNEYKWRFINFVNQSDPVPHMLHHLRSTASALVRTALSEADSLLQSLGGLAGRCIEGFSDGGAAEALRVLGKGTGQLVAQGVLKGARMIANKIHDLSRREIDFSDVPEKPDFHPIGQYISLHVDGQGLRWSSSQYYGGDLRIQDLFYREVKYTYADVEHHLIKSYKRVLVQVGFIHSPASSDHGSGPSNPHLSSRQLLVSTPTPKVTFAKWLHVEDQDSNQRYILVKGENLLFLREAVTVTGSNGQEPWNITKQSDSYLVIHDPHEMNPDTKGLVDSQNPITMVIIKTAFGEISQQTILKEYPNHEGSLTGASRMIGKIVQTLMVKATPPLCIRPDSNRDVATGLDSIMRCVPSLKGERMSTKLVQITTFAKTGSDLETHIKEINYMSKSVVKCLRSCLKVDYDSLILKNLKKRVRAFLRGRPELAAAASVVGIILLPITLGASFLGFLLLRASYTMIDGYDLVLQCAILESSEWSERGSTDYDHTKTNGCNIDHLEMVLYEKVAGSTPEFQDLVKRAHSVSAKNIPCFKSAAFQNATSQSRLKLLRRIKVVYDTISLHNKVVVGTHFIGVFGAEDVGKSSFIKKALKKFGPPGAPLPETGFRSHTTIVSPYMLNSSLWLVDFPGGNGTEHYADIWKQFTALSSSAVLFLDFQGDVKREQVKMYQKTKKDLGADTKVDIVFNKVDLKYTPRNQAEMGVFTFDYFKDLKERNRSKMECSSEDEVHFSCIDPDPPERLNGLKKMGVLGFKELMKVVYPALS